MDVQLSADQGDVIDRIAENQGFHDFDVTASPGSSKGDNYMGSGRDEPPKKLHLILKSASRSAKLRETIPIKKAYLREIYVYDTIFPAFESFLKEHDCPVRLSPHAKLLGSCVKDFEECVVLENLKEAGYDLWDRTTPMDWDHIALVLKEYGKFHAISLAMKEKDPELYEELTKDLDNVFGKPEGEEEDEEKRKGFEAFMKKNVGNGIKAVKGNQKAVDALERFSDVVAKFMVDDIRAPEDMLVVLHGDCWNNNMLFKYEDPQAKRPSQVCLIDWQLSATGSPGMDLSYFLFTCAPKEILADQEKCLRTYHDAASETLGGLGLDPESIYPFDLVEHHWKKYSRFGLYMALSLLKLMLSEGQEVPDMAELADSGEDLLDGFSYTSVNEDKYNQRVRDMMTVCVDNGWL
ncbi:hypothetical protein NQ318_013354 [Aromia moschata]|uniref:CHK kinase-like domain-containing protein n=1 Tax=Aromia moschata TaxID=1265417 RepID=A0AAV8XUU3_9CUCU|nr:hypothetical protein NQ318_013354 [Aromia moschata]